MDDTVQEPGLSSLGNTTLSKGQLHHRRQVALRLWEEPVAAPDLLGVAELHPRYKQRRRRESRVLLLHAVGMLLVLVMLEVMGKV